MLQMNVKRKIGSNVYNFTFHGEDLHEAITASQHIAFPDVLGCGFCDSEHLQLRAYTTKEDEYKYVKIQCMDCRATLTLGRTKKDGAYFLRRHSEDKTLEWEKYDPKRSQSSAGRGGDDE